MSSPYKLVGIAYYGRCGCINCLRTFHAREIKSYLDNGRKAVCPFCGYDETVMDTDDLAVLGEFHESTFHKKEQPQRVQVELSEFMYALSEIEAELKRRLEEKGQGLAYSDHETIGLITEEIDEAAIELHDNDRVGFKRELIDVAVACILGVTTVNNT